MTITLVLVFVTFLMAIGSVHKRNVTIKELKEHELLDSIQSESELNRIHLMIGQLTTSRQKLDKPTKESVWDFITETPAWYPEYVMAQAILESNCGNSNVAKKKNNMFGMFYPRKRMTCATGNYGEYSNYKNWKLSVLDRLLWERAYFDNKKPTESEYLESFKYYAEDKQYIGKIKEISKKYK